MFDHQRSGREDHSVPLDEDGLLLRELAHRTAGEIAASTAVLRIALSRRGPALRHRMLLESLRRLEAFGRLNDLLARPPGRSTDVANLMSGLCHAAAACRGGGTGVTLVADLHRVTMDGAAARRLALIAAELVLGAIDHTATGGGGRVTLALRRVRDDVVLAVVDDGRGIRADARPARARRGRGIVEGLVGAARGEISIDSGSHGTSVRVIVPATCGEDDDAFPF